MDILWRFNESSLKSEYAWNSQKLFQIDIIWYPINNILSTLAPQR